MDARQLHASLIRRGFTLYTKDGRIAVQPASKLTQADSEAIRRNREELLDLLFGAEALELVRRIDPDAMFVDVRPVASTGPLPTVGWRPPRETRERRAEVVRTLVEGRADNRVLDALRAAELKLPAPTARKREVEITEGGADQSPEEDCP